MAREKRCRKCGKVKPITQFLRHYKTDDGHQHVCIDCCDGIIDRTGERYGRLTVIRRVAKRKAQQQGRSNALWLCRCDCGNKTVVASNDLHSGHTQSCGCLREEMRRLPEGQAAFNLIVAQMKANAKRRRLEWSLTKSQVSRLTKQPCAYCGSMPNQTKGSGRYCGSYTYNGLDRVDNDRGYVIDNVVPCCGVCNRGKGAMTVEEFTGWVKRVYEHLRLEKQQVLSVEIVEGDNG